MRRRKMDIQSDFNEMYILLRNLGVPVSWRSGDHSRFMEFISKWMDDGGR